MRRSFSSLILVLALASTEMACYEDSVLSPHSTQALTRVFLTGTPFPYGTVSTVEVYVVDIAASTEPDTVADSGSWTYLARPMRRFDLQQMQQSRSLLIEALSLPADSYHVVRVTINQDSSIVRFVDGTEAKVQWQDAGFLSVFALVEEPILVPDSGTSVVICIDAEQSFLSGLGNPIHDFLFRPVIRAVNGAFTGSIAGTILGDSDGDGFAEPIANSRTTVFRSDGGFDPDAWVKTATGFSDSTGYYKVGFLLPGSYVVQLEATESNVLRSLFAHDVEVVAGEEFVFSVTLPVGTAAWNPSWR